MTRPTPERTLIAAILARFRDPLAGIETQGHDPIVFAEAPQGDPIEEFVQPAQNWPYVVYVRARDGGPGELTNGSQAILNFEVECVVFGMGPDAIAVGHNVWDILTRLMQATGEELVRPEGCTGAGAGRFGLGTTEVSQVADLTPVGTIEGPAPVVDESKQILFYKGVYRFQVEQRMLLTGGTASV